jgi:hypothetical protein
LLLSFPDNNTIIFKSINFEKLPGLEDLSVILQGVEKESDSNLSRKPVGKSAGFWLG